MGRVPALGPNRCAISYDVAEVEPMPWRSGRYGSRIVPHALVILFRPRGCVGSRPGPRVSLTDRPRLRWLESGSNVVG